MSYEDLDRFHDNTTLTDTSWRVMAVICRHANDKGAAWPSTQTLIAKAKVGGESDDSQRRALRRAIQAAKDAGELHVIPGKGKRLTKYVVLVGLSEDERRERMALHKIDTESGHTRPLDDTDTDTSVPQTGHPCPQERTPMSEKADMGALQEESLKKEGKEGEERGHAKPPTVIYPAFGMHPTPKGSSDGYTYTPDPLTHPANHDPQPMVAKRIMPISTLSPLEQGWEMAKQTVQMSVNAATYDYLVDPLVIVDYIEGVIRIRCFPQVQARVVEGFARALFRACKRQPMFAKAHSVLIEARHMDAVMVTPEVQGVSAATLPSKGRVMEVNR